MMYKINKIIFQTMLHLKTMFKRKADQKKGSYLSSKKFLEDMRRAAEKGAEEQTRIMHEAGMEWSNETVDKNDK